MIRRAALLAAAAMLAPLPLAAQDAAPAPATTATPLPSAHGYQPQDELERGLWYEMAEQERLLRQSHFLVDDPALNAYVRGVLCRTVGAERCAATRLYLVRTPFFNASMAPNGAMIVNTGLLLRMRDEAQLAAVLGHEFTHFEQQHSLRLFRNMRTKTDILSIFSLAPIPYAAGMVGQIAILSSVFGFNREMEREADAGSIAELARAGYDPTAASTIWQQLGDEMDATAAERRHRSRRNSNGGLFATHPRTTERMETLAALATQAAASAGAAERRAAEYRSNLHAWWPQLIDDQVRLADFGGTEYLLSTLAGPEPDGWTADLLYARGELYRDRGREGDFASAATFYRQAIDQGGGPEESWRGYGLALLRQGHAAEGRAALRTYLQLKPQAHDAAMLGAMAAEPVT
ncbi:M48 family metallopeptidase [Qipengyuania sp. YIM B01966]|uniref:M48 family metallopeptidase n=1 Tax=Qipengyuania sp. YIM B01966 TaxID=2778646 RepID=UPI000DB5A68F|nr:M48 family metallopeptidase [Qipengyuania sp. YIM B01966]PZU17947.1 MAG: peptidase M48 [Citromicrobium sp.]